MFGNKKEALQRTDCFPPSLFVYWFLLLLHPSLTLTWTMKFVTPDQGGRPKKPEEPYPWGYKNATVSFD
jgi:hypothetical protein